MNDSRQGDIVWAALDPTKGSEQAGKRPVVVISGDVMNGVMSVRIVCPLTTQCVQRYGRVHIRKNKANGLPKDSEVLTFHIRTISTTRFGKKIGRITDAQLSEIKEKINHVLE